MEYTRKFGTSPPREGLYYPNGPKQTERTHDQAKAANASWLPLGRLLEVGAIGTLNDGELLERFAARTGVEAELAFSVLVGRHGETVLRTCRGILGNEEDSLDAFQATFFILARKCAVSG